MATFGQLTPTILITIYRHHTRGYNLGRIQPRIGDELVTNQRKPIFTIIDDDVGWHDMLAPACDRQRYERYFGVKGHRSCHDNFLEAMGERDWGSRMVPQPFNLFMNTFIDSDGTLLIRDPISQLTGWDFAQFAAESAARLPKTRQENNMWPPILSPTYLHHILKYCT